MKFFISRKNNHGLSLAEVLVAMFVVLVGISGVTATMYWAQKKSGSGKVMSEATNHARVILETIVGTGVIASRVGGGSWPDASSGINDPEPSGTGMQKFSARPELYSSPFVGLQPQVMGQSKKIGLSGDEIGDHDQIGSDIGRFRRKVTVTRMGTAGSYDYRLAKVMVRVYWMEEGLERNVALETIAAHQLNK